MGYVHDFIVVRIDLSSSLPFCIKRKNRVTQLNCLSMTNIRFTTGEKAKDTNGKFRQCATKCKMQLSRIYSHKQFGYKHRLLQLRLYRLL